MCVCTSVSKWVYLWVCEWRTNWSCPTLTSHFSTSSPRLDSSTVTALWIKAAPLLCKHYSFLKLWQQFLYAVRGKQYFQMVYRCNHQSLCWANSLVWTPYFCEQGTCFLSISCGNNYRQARVQLSLIRAETINANSRWSDGSMFILIFKAFLTVWESHKYPFKTDLYMRVPLASRFPTLSKVVWNFTASIYFLALCTMQALTN